MRTKSAKRSVPVIIAVAVVVLVAAGYAVLHFTKAHSHAKQGDYYEVTDSGMKLCLVPKVAEGACFELDGTYAAKVTKVVAGKVDESACGEGGDALVFAEPPTTLCLRIPRTN